MTDWNYRIDGYGGIVTVKRSIDNTVESVYVDMDCYAQKTLTDREYEQLDESEQDEYDWVDDEEPQWAKYGKGAYAKLRFSVDSDGVAEFDGVNDDNWDEDGYNFPTWLRLVDPAERLVAEVDGVEEVKDTTDQFHKELEVGETATITN